MVPYERSFKGSRNSSGTLPLFGEIAGHQLGGGEQLLVHHLCTFISIIITVFLGFFSIIIISFISTHEFYFVVSFLFSPPRHWEGKEGANVHVVLNHPPGQTSTSSQLWRLNPAQALYNSRIFLLRLCQWLGKCHDGFLGAIQALAGAEAVCASDPAFEERLASCVCLFVY